MKGSDFATQNLFKQPMWYCKNKHTSTLKEHLYYFGIVANIAPGA